MQLKLAAIVESLNQATEGKLEFNAPIPESLTPIKTLELSAKLMKAALPHMKESARLLATDERNAMNPSQWRATQEGEIDRKLYGGYYFN